MKYWFVALVLVGCAQPQSGRTTSSSSSGGGTTSVGGLSDLSVDPTADLSMTGGNLPDFGGHDLAKLNGDLATVCDPVKQTGCGAGQKCALGASGPECAISGNVDTAGACGAASSDDCKAGNICLQEDATHLLCRQFCGADSDCKQASVGGASNVGHCIISINGVSYQACTTPCNPVAPTSGCPTGMACIHAHTMSMTELTNCEIVGTKMNTDPCTTINDCAPGFTCVSLTSGGTTTVTCRKVCKVLADCTMGMCNKQNVSDTWGACF